MQNQIRVRFAPSPTGDPHLGSIRTALFNWLFARQQNNGKFILRIEDTDQSRMQHNSDQKMISTLKWLGLNWDEGPYYQSKRLEKYHSAINTLIKNNKAYKCYCTPERLADLKTQKNKNPLTESSNKYIGYDKLCRENPQPKTSKSYVVRFAMPETGETVFNDLVRQQVTFKNALLEDFIILKSDNFPTYHLANVVDDHDMNISHVFRAEEWLPSTPKHINLYNALGYTIPKFGHLPMLLSQDRTKLSKRHGATSIMELINIGYIPIGLINFLALLGWSLDDKTEIFQIEELIKNFDINNLTKSGAIVDYEKLSWINGHHIKSLDIETLTTQIFEFWESNPPKNFEISPTIEKIKKIVPLIQNRIKILSEIPQYINFYFQKTINYNIEELIQKGMDLQSTKIALDASKNSLNSLEKFDSKSIEISLRNTAKELKIKPGQLLSTIRVALTGQKISPSLFEIIELNGIGLTIERINSAIEKISKFNNIK
ncbi:MAG: glutamate--tRNA ligase [SAR202 cluster bacterium]|nr:glutamate--tRNA ligase [SAR202 cluster bacterium]|tara:strand:- start:53539 stop:54999 length:1461 start_codon:yes stop_codon:yes gene_type:complete